MQHTLKDTASLSGIGLHSGASVEMHIHPAEEDTGIVFFRSDVKNGGRIVAARWNRVVDTRLCTVVGNEYGVSVGTIEHLMAALRGCGVDNAVVELNGPEVPVMDGSSVAFVEAIRAAGLARQAEPRRVIRVLKEISVEDGNRKVTLSPSDEFAFSGEIDFTHPSVGRQSFGTTLVNGNFVHDLADCRTFGFLHEVEYMRSQGLARGGSLENAIVLDEKGVMNPDGLRRPDEFIRHKLLDAVGDLYLAGAPILGAYHGIRAGHAVNNAVLHRLFADLDAFEIVRTYDGGSVSPAISGISAHSFAVAG
ncbi:MAG: UDP-3-O-acyl-N-acetylglucosamine deacetylase [Alphaproteobacteria bacterium]|nr:UDP-3-O-acyl-N-acetylglucosamine deacetylase [Alphaproteobacteria bacterium]